jgi:hypothetical protein
MSVEASTRTGSSGGIGLSDAGSSSADDASGEIPRGGLSGRFDMSQYMTPPTSNSPHTAPAKLETRIPVMMSFWLIQS